MDRRERYDHAVIELAVSELLQMSGWTCDEKYTGLGADDKNSICMDDGSTTSFDTYSGDLKDDSADLSFTSARTMGNYKRSSRMNKSHPLNLQLGSTKQNDKSFNKGEARWIYTDINIEKKDQKDIGPTKQNDKSFKKWEARWIYTDINIEKKTQKLNRPTKQNDKSFEKGEARWIYTDVNIEKKDTGNSPSTASARTMGNYKRSSRMDKSHPLNLQLGSTGQNDKSYKKQQARWIYTAIP